MNRAGARYAVPVAMLVAAAPLVMRSPSASAPVSPRVSMTGEYVTSSACRSCHPSAYASWHRTYHRTMTQRVDASRQGPPLPPEPALLLATGSHHYQGFWLAGQRAGELRMFPLVYLFGERRWIPRKDAFLQPPDAEEHDVRWNSNCIQCHATGGQPGRNVAVDRFDTEVVELGIACEACHGPGGEHVRRHRDPVERYASYAAAAADPSIVNPSRLPADRASMICGQCHSLSYPREENEWWESGYVRSYRPGQDLAASRYLLTRQSLGETGSPVVDTSLESLFWPDGTIRVGGREYAGLAASACFTRGEGARKLSCSSCHSMHASDPDDQLRGDLPGNEACFACHEGMRSHVAEHTHHGVRGSGSLCTSCHMAPTTYALLKAIRSHRIDSPDVHTALGAGRPPACNLCHVDRSLAWTAKHLEQWYGMGPPPLEPEAPTGAAVRWLLSGDAAQRVIAAAAFGSREAQEASGTGWQAPLLAQALLDPYAAVRIVAHRSLRTLPGFETFAYDPFGPPEERTRAARGAVELWERREGKPFDQASADRLVARRDERAVTIAE